MHGGNPAALGGHRTVSMALRGSRGPVGPSPPAPHERTGPGHHDGVDVCAAGEPLAVALAKAHRRLLAAVLENLGWRCESPVPGATPLGGIAVGPGPCTAGPPGL